MRMKGKIASWNDDKGYGFIAPLGDGPQVFVHIKAFHNRDRRPEINGVVTYSISKDKRGRTRAVNATLAGDKLVVRESRSRSGAKFAAVISALFLAAIGVSISTGKLPPLILAAYIVVSFITFVVYAFDKSAAKNGRWRTSESALHMFALAGGWPGAWIAQQALRHKSKKTAFRIVFWATVLMNCGGLIWLHTPAGQAYLHQLLNNGDILRFLFSANH